MKLKRLLAIFLAVLITVIQISSFAEDETPVRTFSVTAVTPYDGAKNISPVNLKMDVTFSEAVDASTLSMTSISVSGGIFSSVMATGENTATIFFNRDLLVLGEKYTVTFKEGIKAKSGASMEEKKVTFSLTKDAPSYRQISNQDLSDPYFISGFGGDTTRDISIVNQDGNNVLKFLTPGWNEAAVKSKAFIEGGKTYCSRVRVKTETTQPIWLALFYNVPNNAHNYHDMARVEIPAGQWTTIENTWTIEDNAEVDGQVDVMVAVKNPGTITYIDDWYFYEQGNDVDQPKEEAGGGTAGRTYLSQSNTAMDRAKALGVIAAGASEKATFSRYDFAKTLLNIVGVGSNTVSGDTRFLDVSEEQSGVVNAVTGIGLMNGCSDTAFEPDSVVTVDQAIKMMVSVMGWSAVAEDQGGYPYGYRSVAATLGLLQDLSSDGESPLNCADFAAIFDHALDADVLSAKVYRHSVDDFERVRGGSFLETFFDCESGRGKIEGTESTYLYQESDLKSGQVCIDGKIYQCDADLDPYLGYGVTYYYQKSDDSIYDEIIYIGGLEDGNRVVNIQTFDDKVTYLENQYSVSTADSRKEKVYSLTRDKDVVYNGRYLGSYQDTEETFVPSYGTIKLVDSGNGFDTVIITDIQTMMVSGVDYNKQVIYGQEGDAAIDLSDCDEPLIVDNEETPYKMKDIVKGTVVSAIVSKDHKMAKLYISNRTIAGPLCEVRKHDLNADLVIGDRFYGGNVRETYGSVNEYFKADQIALGTLGTFHLDYRGKVAGFVIGSAIDGVGYLVDAKSTSSGFDSTVEFKIYDSSDKLVYLSGADRIKIDNTTVKKASEALSLLKKGTTEVVSQLILYKTDADGKVVSIDTAYNKQPGVAADYRTLTPPAGEDSNSFRISFSCILPTTNDAGTLVTSDRTIVCNPNVRTFENKVLLKENPTIFIVPRDAKSAEDEMFIMSGSAWDIGDGNASKIESYNTTGDSLYADYLVVYADPGAYGTTWMDEYKYGLVTDRRSIIKNDTITEEIILEDGSSRYTDNPAMLNGVSVGDYIKFCQDKHKYLTRAAVVLFDADQRTVSGGNPSAGWNEYNRMMYAGVYERTDSIFKLVPSSNQPNVDFSEQNLLLKGELINGSGAKTFIYDTEHKTVIGGSQKEILGYKDAGNGYSNILVVFEKSIVRLVMIIE